MDIRWVVNRNLDISNQTATRLLNEQAAFKAMTFDSKFSQYGKTPLISLKNLAGNLGVQDIYVKDESLRFGLKSFKVLGGMYAVGNCIAQKLGMDIDRLEPNEMKAENTQKKLGEIIFATATDGNHGKGVAFVANLLGYQSFVYMPAGSSKERVDSIKKYGAKTFVTDLNYDETVEMVAEKAAVNGWTVVQDTAWDGYQQIPEWIIQGYSVLAYEAQQQLEEMKAEMPTHIILQAGVGAFASSVAGYFSVNSRKKPVVAIVEPDKADCIYRSAKTDGIETVGGKMNTIMCGLACGVPNPIAWDILRNSADVFVSVDDAVAARGMRIYGNPIGDDIRIESGESGAVTLGLLSLVMQRAELAKLKEALSIDENSRILLISTEGATDQSVYRQVVWDGAYPIDTINL